MLLRCRLTSPPKLFELQVENYAYLLKEKNTPVLVYCHAGKRATFFMKAMVRDGYTHIMNMGGIEDWKYETTLDEPSKSFAEAIKEVPHCCNK